MGDVELVVNEIAAISKEGTAITEYESDGIEALISMQLRTMLSSDRGIEAGGVMGIQKREERERSVSNCRGISCKQIMS